MEFSARQTVIVAIIVLFIGRYLNKRFAFLQHFNIPEPVSGALPISLIFSLIYALWGFEVTFSLEQRDALLVVFFTCVGLSSKLSTLKQGGTALITLLVLAVLYLFLQNLTGVIVSSASGLEPSLGVLAGSVSLSGGHGTAIAWAPIFSQNYNIPNAMEIGVACATFGLVLGGIVGGPIANYLIKKHNLSNNHHQSISVGVQHESHTKITVNDVYSFLLVLTVAIGIGLNLHAVLTELGIQLPLFVPCIFGGILLTNTIPLIWKNVDWPTGKPTIALASDVSLGLFLSMSLMSLQLYTLVDLALPMLLLLVAQVVVVTLFVIYLIFPVMGKNYDAAVMSSGYAGLALGATPTAIANMTAVTKKYGASPMAFLIIPLIGAFFIDISNAVIIQLMLGWVS